MGGAMGKGLLKVAEPLCGLHSTTRCCNCNTGCHRGRTHACHQRIVPGPIAEEAWSDKSRGTALAPECKQAYGEEELHGDGDGEDHGHVEAEEPGDEEPHNTDNEASLWCCGTGHCTASRNGQRTCGNIHAQAAQVCNRARSSPPWTRSCGSSPAASRWYCSQPGPCSAPRSNSPGWSCLQPESRSANCARSPARI